MCSAGTVRLRLRVEEGTIRGPLAFLPTILLTSGYNVGVGHRGQGDSCREGVSILGDSLQNIKSRWKKVLLLLPLLPLKPLLLLLVDVAL